MGYFTDASGAKLKELSKQQRDFIVAEMQKLTDDKLRYNEKTNRIDIVHTARAKDIKHPNGIQLVRDLIGETKVVTIHYAELGGSSAGSFGDNRQNPKFSDGTGDNTNIIFSKNNVNSLVAKSEYESAKSTPQPSFIVLGGEMCHALAQMKGQRLDDTKKREHIYLGENGKMVTERVTLEELTAHGIGTFVQRSGKVWVNENSLRNDHNLPKRVAYEGFSGQTNRK